MTLINIPMTTEVKYQQAAQYFTQTGLSHVWKRQWEFIREPDQKYFLLSSFLLTVATVSYCTYKGVEIGKEISKSLSLNNEKKQMVIVCGGGAGFLAGVGLSVTGSSLAIEHSNRMEKWKELKINQVVTRLMQEEFQDDPVWSQFTCAISQESIYLPTRTPAGQVFDYHSLMEAADRNGVVKDIYNKRIPVPTELDETATQPISYSVDACVKDSEMMIVICKRFRHLATEKSQEQGLSTQTKEFFMSYRNSLGELVKNVYIEAQERINKKRNDIQLKDHVTELQVEEAEKIYNQEIAIFKLLFGETPLSNIDWSIKHDWGSILNNRWIAQYH